MPAFSLAQGVGKHEDIPAQRAGCKPVAKAARHRIFTKKRKIARENVHQWVLFVELSVGCFLPDKVA